MRLKAREKSYFKWLRVLFLCYTDDFKHESLNDLQFHLFLESWLLLGLGLSSLMILYMLSGWVTLSSYRHIVILQGIVATIIWRRKGNSTDVQVMKWETLPLDFYFCECIIKDISKLATFILTLISRIIHTYELVGIAYSYSSV